MNKYKIRLDGEGFAKVAICGVFTRKQLEDIDDYMRYKEHEDDVCPSCHIEWGYGHREGCEWLKNHKKTS